MRMYCYIPITDACLGAIGEGDIGKHFPDTDPTLKMLIQLNCFKKYGNL